MIENEDVARAAERTAAGIRVNAEHLKAKRPDSREREQVLLHLESRAIDWDRFAIELRRGQ